MNDILEMLDALEGAVGRLGAERVALAAALGEAERRLKAASEPARPRAKRAKAPVKKSATTRRKPPAKAVAEPPAAAPVAEEAKPERPVRAAPKRQALGRGLSQLRRVPAVQEPAN